MSIDPCSFLAAYPTLPWPRTKQSKVKRRTLRTKQMRKVNVMRRSMRMRKSVQKMKTTKMSCTAKIRTKEMRTRMRRPRAGMRQRRVQWKKGMKMNDHCWLWQTGCGKGMTTEKKGAVGHL